MKPLEAAARAINRVDLPNKNDPDTAWYCGIGHGEQIAKKAILAFLRAAMGDEALCVGAGAYRPGNNSSLTRGKSAIQALIDYVEQP